MKSKFLSILLTVCMVVGVFSASGLSASALRGTGSYPGVGDGSSENPYQIGTAEELFAFAQAVNGGETGANAVLTADITVNDNVIDLSGNLTADLSGMISWTPVGNASNPYTGVFDGQGHSISGLYIETDENLIGLFGWNKGTVKNVGVTGSYIKGKNSVGGICGFNQGGSVIACFNTGTVIGNRHIGGVCGYNNNGESVGNVTGCYNTGRVIGEENVGGVCGYNNGAVVASYSVEKTVGAQNIGGICGLIAADGTADGCFYLQGSVEPSADENTTEALSVEEFKNGRACILLNRALTDSGLTVRFCHTATSEFPSLCINHITDGDGICEICCYGDTTPPNGKISSGFANWYTFQFEDGYVFKLAEMPTLTITAEDNCQNRNTDIEYWIYTGTEYLHESDLADKDFVPYSEPIEITADGRYVLYARLTDFAGNVSYISTTPIIVDTVAPVISGVENGKTYCGAQTVTVEEKNIHGVYVNDEFIQLDENNSFVLYPADGEQTVSVYDIAYNFTEIKVTVNAEHTGGTATCGTKAVCEICHNECGDTDPSNHGDLRHISEKKATYTEQGNIEYWYCGECNKYFSDAAAQNEITKDSTVTPQLVKSALPKTGGETDIGIWTAALLLSSLCFIGIYKGKKKNISRTEGSR